MSSPADCNFSWHFGNLKVIAESRKVHTFELCSGQKSIDCYLNGRCSLLMTFLTQVLTFHDLSQQHSGKVAGSILSVDTLLFLIRKFCARQSFDHCQRCWVRWLWSLSLVPRVSVLFCCLNHLALARVSLTRSPGLPLGYFTEWQLQWELNLHSSSIAGPLVYPHWDQR